MTDYEKWKDWLDQWDIKYEENECGDHITLITDVLNSCIFISFDKITGKFKCITT